MRAAPLILIFAIAGCAGSPAQVLTMNPEKLQEVGIGPLCNAYAYSGHENETLETEIRRRDTMLAADPSYNPDRLPFTEREWDAIKGKKIFIGMSEAALYCSWGAPSQCGDINTSVGSWGTHRQIVYRGCGSYSSSRYVYTENGYVTSWQQ
jgi:hypothetical protein